MIEYREQLEPCVRAYFAKRVCIVGAESTGTTTVAQALAAHFRTNRVPGFRGKPFIILSGSREERLSTAVSECTRILQEKREL